MRCAGVFFNSEDDWDLLPIRGVFWATTGLLQSLECYIHAGFRCLASKSAPARATPRRMLIENGLADAVHFFHLDALSSAVRLKIGF